MYAISCHTLFSKSFPKIGEDENCSKYLSRRHIKFPPLPHLPLPPPTSPVMDFTLPTDNNFHPQLTENSSPLQFTEDASGGQCNLLHPAEME